MADAITAADAAHVDAMELASKQFLTALELERGNFDIEPRDLPQRSLIWPKRGSSTTWSPVPDSWQAQRKSAALARLLERDRTAEENRTHREPCFRCGVRADVGCSHRRVA